MKIKIAILLTECKNIRELNDSISLYKKNLNSKNIDFKIILAYNGSKDISEIINQVDDVILQPLEPHNVGAIKLFNLLIERYLEKYSQYDYVLIGSGDVRLRQEFIDEVLSNISKKLDVTTSIWFLSGFSTEINLLSRRACQTIYPFGTAFLSNKFLYDFLVYIHKLRLPIVESLFTISALRNILKLKISLFSSRKFVFKSNRHISRGYDSTNY